MREDPRIFFAHTLRHVLVEDVHFYSLDRRSDFFSSRIREGGLRDEYTDMRVAHGDIMVARERRCEYILHAKRTT